MNSLEKCHLLSRVSLICPAVTWHMQKERFFNLFKSFCQNLDNLVALFAVLKVPKAYQEVNEILVRNFREERPAFCVDIQSTTGPYSPNVSYHSNALPLMHKYVLNQIESQVGIFPFDRDSILDRLK